MRRILNLASAALVVLAMSTLVVAAATEVGSKAPVLRCFDNCGVVIYGQIGGFTCSGSCLGFFGRCKTCILPAFAVLNDTCPCNP